MALIIHLSTCCDQRTFHRGRTLMLWICLVFFSSMRGRRFACVITRSRPEPTSLSKGRSSYYDLLRPSPADCVRHDDKTPNNRAVNPRSHNFLTVRSRSWMERTLIRFMVKICRIRCPSQHSCILNFTKYLSTGTDAKIQSFVFIRLSYEIMNCW